MAFYLKVSSGLKMKKYIVYPNKYINLRQIKIGCGFQSQDNSLLYEICEPSAFINSSQKQKNIPTKEILNHSLKLKDQQFLQFFQNNDFPSGFSVKVKIYKRAGMSEMQHDESDNEQIQAPFSIKKNRSRSQQITNILNNQFVQSLIQTQQSVSFDLQATEQFLFQSTMQIKSKLDEVNSFIKLKDNQLRENKEKKKETNIGQLLHFLENYK